MKYSPTKQQQQVVRRKIKCLLRLKAHKLHTSSEKHSCMVYSTNNKYVQAFVSCQDMLTSLGDKCCKANNYNTTPQQHNNKHINIMRNRYMHTYSDSRSELLGAPARKTQTPAKGSTHLYAYLC